jgi:hypothetical protein
VRTALEVRLDPLGTRRRLTRGSEVVVWILEVPKSVFKGGKLDEKSLKSWLKEVHEKAYRQFMGVERIVWYDPEIKLGVKLFERLREDRKRYGDSGAVLDVFLEMFK